MGVIVAEPRSAPNVIESGWFSVTIAIHISIFPAAIGNNAAGLPTGPADGQSVRDRRLLARDLDPPPALRPDTRPFASRLSAQVETSLAGTPKFPWVCALIQREIAVKAC